MYKSGRKPAKVAMVVGGCALAAFAAIGGLAGAAPRKATTDMVAASSTATPTTVIEPTAETVVEAASATDDGSTDATAAEVTSTEPVSSPKRDAKTTSGSGKTGGRKGSTSTTSTTAVATTEPTTTTAPAPTTTTTAAPVPPAVDEPAPTTTTDTAFVESFVGLPPLWADGATIGRWLVQYTGYGSVGTTTVDGVPALVTAPKASTSPGETHAAMVTTTDRFGNLDLTLRTKTRRQLRTGSAPNPWEVGWVVWAHERDERFYYIVLKPNGWELGKADDTRRDPAGPECTWPEYVNCKYAGAQRFLATGSSPTFAVGQWHDLRVRQVGSTITVWGNGNQLTSFTDNENPYPSGVVGLYNEDADVAFANLRIERL